MTSKIPQILPDGSYLNSSPDGRGSLAAITAYELERTVANAAESAPRGRLGLGAYSCGLCWRAQREGKESRFHDTISFLEYAHSLGAAGVQASLPTAEHASASRLRARSEELDCYYEGELRLPRDEMDTARFETDVKALRTAGATIARTAVLGTRRYETFKTASAFAEFHAQSIRALQLAHPILERNRLKLAIENHKDWLVQELVDLLQALSTEWIGVCLDTGNSLALLEDPYAVVESLAPYAFTVHLKDMALQGDQAGFQLSEIPLGAGFLDIPRIVEVLRRTKPQIAFNLEMITRDPLRIPCLAAEYWTTLSAIKARQLAETLARVKANPPKEPPPRITGLDFPAQLALEEQNNQRSIQYFRTRW